MNIPHNNHRKRPAEHRRRHLPFCKQTVDAFLISFPSPKYLTKLKQGPVALYLITSERPIHTGVGRCLHHATIIRYAERESRKRFDYKIIETQSGCEPLLVVIEIARADDRANNELAENRQNLYL